MYTEYFCYKDNVRSDVSRYVILYNAENAPQMTTSAGNVAGI